MASEITKRPIAELEAMLLAMEFEDAVEVELIKMRRHAVDEPDEPSFEDDFFGRGRR